MTNEPPKWLIFPLEIVERELNGKLLICNEAIKNGWNCIIGTEQEIVKSLEFLPTGLFFLKSALHHEVPYIKNLQKKGNKVVCLDEEGLVQNNIEYLVSARSTPETIKALDACLFWGSVQKEAYKNAYPDYTEKFHVTSNPRIDIWDKEKYHEIYQETITDIHDRFGEYFIIPTSFGSYNHAMGKDGAMDIYKAGHFITKDSVAFFESYEEYAKNIYYGFVDIIDPLSKKFPNTNIIVRPHPSENRDPWDELAKNYSNVHVVFEGSVTPWLIGAKAILHCGSTTAVEAHLQGKPVISYCRGFNDPEYALEVPSKVSINVTSDKDVLDLLDKVNNGENINDLYPEVQKGHDWLKGWADSIDSYESTQKIISLFNKLNVEPCSYKLQEIKNLPRLNWASFKAFIWFCLQPLGHIPIIKNLLPFKIKFGIKTQKYNKKKINNINPDEVKAFLQITNKINQTPLVETHILRKNIIALTASHD
ncbi:MAG: hypothetical protein CL570_07615 [Alphaproteobacteria bacterium]|nr:hypothetical protein [Alphaproteobacteria bacterium]|tara:strand:- start:10435 stop:11868 length:1434 start_codon:yes stop_codon:yes gene_type:complete